MQNNTDRIKVWLAQYANVYHNSDDLAEAAKEEFQLNDTGGCPLWLVLLAKDACYTAALDQLEMDPLERS